MPSPLPTTALEFMDWTWAQIEPYFKELAERPLDSASLPTWLADWSHLSKLLYETYWRLYVATTVNTSDTPAEQRYHREALAETGCASDAGCIHRAGPCRDEGSVAVDPRGGIQSQ